MPRCLRAVLLALAPVAAACTGASHRPPIDDSPSGGGVGSGSSSDASVDAVTPPVSTPITLAANLDHPQGIALDAASLLITSAPISDAPASGTILRLARNAPATPVPVFTGQDDPFSIAVAPNVAIAWTNRASMFPAGARSALLLAAGSDAPRAVVPGETLATGVAIAAGFVYWTSRDVSGGILVERAALGGGAAETVTTLAALADPAGIAVDAAYVYFVGSGSAASVARAPLAGGVAEVLMDDPGARLVDVLVVGGALYVTDAAGTVLTLPKGGGASQAVATNQASPSHLARDATRVYWTNEAKDGAVMAVPVAGGAPAVLAAHLDRPGAIAVDDAIYFTTFDAVMRLAK
jgi:hypothetical protein